MMMATLSSRRVERRPARPQIGRLRSTKPGRRRWIAEADLLALLGVGAADPSTASDRRR